MKVRIPITAVCLLVFIILSCETTKSVVEEAPEQTPISDCINSTNRNISKAELNLARLKKITTSDNSQETFKKEADKYKTVLKGLDNTIAVCKESEPEYDFTEIDKKVKSIKESYQELLTSQN